VWRVFVFGSFVARPFVRAFSRCCLRLGWFVMNAVVLFLKLFVGQGALV